MQLPYCLIHWSNSVNICGCRPKVKTRLLQRICWFEKMPISTKLDSLDSECRESRNCAKENNLSNVLHGKVIWRFSQVEYISAKLCASLLHSPCRICIRYLPFARQPNSYSSSFFSFTRFQLSLLFLPFYIKHRSILFFFFLLQWWYHDIFTSLSSVFFNFLSPSVFPYCFFFLLHVRFFFLFFC